MKVYDIYAKALIELEDLEDQVTFFKKILTKEVGDFFTNPIVDKEAKKKLIDKVFKQGIANNFFKLMIERGRDDFNVFLRVFIEF